MSGKENGNDQLKAFEVALGSLVPRRDRLDPRWREFLAKQAALSAAILSEQGAAATEAVSEHEGLLDWTPICAFCDRARPAARDVRRWAWPAAFSAMTTVAAVLLVMLVARPGPQMAEGILPGPVEGASPTVTEDDRRVSREPFTQAAPQPSQLAEGSSALRRGWGRHRRPAAPYPQLLDKVLERGLDAWETPSAGAIEDWQTARAPLSSRELLNRLLNEARPPNSPPPPARNPSNAQEPDNESA